MQLIERDSSSINRILVDPIKGEARVQFLTGYEYEYKNVNRFAIMNLLKDAKLSLGKWVNKNLVWNKRVDYKLLKFYPTNQEM